MALTKPGCLQHMPLRGLTGLTRCARLVIPKEDGSFRVIMNSASPALLRGCCLPGTGDGTEWLHMPHPQHHILGYRLLDSQLSFMFNGTYVEQLRIEKPVL